ncbi:MAG: hypothetical protein ACJ8IR_00765 [Alphaproteobacteria bacterium]|jgi:hypothetical protein
MILRAIFWMAVVAVLAPHGFRSASARCDHGACSRGVELFERIRDSGLHSLAQVHADIEAAERARSRG